MPASTDTAAPLEDLVNREEEDKKIALALEQEIEVGRSWIEELHAANALAARATGSNPSALRDVAARIFDESTQRRQRLAALYDLDPSSLSTLTAPLHALAKEAWQKVYGLAREIALESGEAARGRERRLELTKEGFEELRQRLARHAKEQKQELEALNHGNELENGENSDSHPATGPENLPSDR